MIEFYGTSSPNVLKVSLMLAETDLAYERRYVSIYQGEQYSAEYLKISPMNRLPGIVDRDGPGGAAISVMESGAILIYLAEKTGRFLSQDPRARSAELQWLMAQMSTIGPMGGQAVHFTRFAPPGNDYARERYYSQCAHLHGVLDRRLAEVEYLGGEACSIADFATYPWVLHAERFFDWLQDGGLARRYPNLERYRATMAARPGIQRGMEEMKVFDDLAATAREAKSPEAMERFVLRGAYSEAPAAG